MLMRVGRASALMALTSATIARAAPPDVYRAPAGSLLGTLVRQDPDGPREVGVRMLVLYGRELKWPIVAHYEQGKTDLNGVPWILAGAADSVTAQPPNALDAMLTRATSAYRDTLAALGEPAARHAAIARLDSTVAATDADGPRAPRFYANGSCRVFLKGVRGFFERDIVQDDPGPPQPSRASLEWARSSFAELQLHFRSAPDAAVVISAGGVQVTSGEMARRAEDQVHIVQRAAHSSVRGAVPTEGDLLTGAAIREIVAFERGQAPAQ
jgi:hypothetical protein